MSDFQLYFLTGLTHVLSLDGIDHILFLAMLALPYTFKDWKQVLLLTTLFTIGHTMTLVLSVYGPVRISAEPIEFFISFTIFATALYNVFRAGKTSSANTINFVAITTLFFGIIHGLGFGKDFRIIISGSSGNSFLTLLEFTLGIEIAQLIVVLGVLFTGIVVTDVLKLNRRDWLLVLSAFVAGISLTYVTERRFW